MPNLNALRTVVYFMFGRAPTPLEMVLAMKLIRQRRGK